MTSALCAVQHEQQADDLTTEPVGGGKVASDDEAERKRTKFVTAA
jgi:hypothetical protein